MFTEKVSVARMTQKNLEIIDALVPGTVKRYNIQAVETESQALEVGVEMMERLLVRYEYIRTDVTPIIVETDKGWDITFSIAGD